ncbi:7895_t:CDS:2, partial [Gigaspora margarita]
HAKCGICSRSLTYNDWTTLNLLRHLKRHKGKMPELDKSAVKKGVSVLEMLSNNARQYEELKSILTYLEPIAD